MIQKPRGTKDLFGKDLALYKYIISKLEKLFISFGYEEIKTPIFEKKEVFDKSDLSNILANKEYFYIKDRKQSIQEPDTFSCVLRPELTAPIIRSLVENKILNKQTESKSLNYFYCGECFRYDRPQEGRFRQFIQMGIEKINSHSIYHDMENVFILKTISDLFGLKNTKIKINYFGSSETKDKWNDSLKKYFRDNIDRLTEDSKKRIAINPFRIFDESKFEDSDLILASPKISDYFSDEEKKYFDTINDFFSEDSDVEWDPFLVRGLDYYTGLIYELVDVSSGLSLAAGGRYDDLVQMFYGKKIPSLGLAVGVDRIKYLLDKENIDFGNAIKKIVLFSSSDLSEQIFWRKIFRYKQTLSIDSKFSKVIVETRMGVSSKYVLDKYGKDSTIFDIFDYEL